LRNSSSAVAADLHREALAELRRAAIWYDEQRPGLGDEVCAAVARAPANKGVAADELASCQLVKWFRFARWPVVGGARG
jgi:hypothetical protein